MNKLQKSLLLNGLFSGTSGLTLILLNNQIASLFETNNSIVFVVIGFALLFFASTIIYETIKQRPIGVLWIVIQDYLWVAGSIIILIINPFQISTAGNLLITLIALIVLFMGIIQANALSELDSLKNDTKKQLLFERIISADKHSVWETISDVANYDKVAPNIDKVKIVSGNGVGLVRSCSHKKDIWTETCTMWVEGKAYSFIVNTSDPRYPHPFEFLKGTWELQELNSYSTKITIYFDFQYKRSYQNWLFHPLMKGNFSKTIHELLDNWQKILED